MAMMNCRVCGKEVSREAQTCPHCGESNPSLHQRCPKCSSGSVDSEKQGFGFKKAAVGGLLLGPAGLTAGALGRNKLQLHCRSCGHKWK